MFNIKNTEIAEVMNQDGYMMGWARRVHAKLELSEEDTEIAQVVDKWAKEIGYGRKDAYELSEFIRKTIEPEVANAPDEILDFLFDRGSVGEFDDVALFEDAKNTLVVHESAKNGTVDKSYIDYRATRTSWRNLQIATEISMEKLRKGGYKTVADYTVYAEEAFKNKMFFIIFDALDKAITSPSEQAVVSGARITEGAIDTAVDYLLDRGTDPFLVGLTKNIRPISKFAGYQALLSEDMKNELNKYGIIQTHQGTRLMPIQSTYKLADGNPIFPANKVIGIAGKIGTMDMKGEMRVLQTIDNKREVVELEFKGYQFGYAFGEHSIENVFKITIE